MLVEIRPVPTKGDRKPWEGAEEYDFTRPKVYEVLYSSELGCNATGLTEEEAIEYGKRIGVDLSSRFDSEKPHPYW